MPTVHELLASVDAARDEIVRLHQDLVRIPTVNYGSRPDTGNETPACELIRDKLKEAGIGSDIYESAPTRGNLIARHPGPAGGKRLLLMSHADVVPVEDESLWEHPPFSGHDRQGPGVRARRRRRQGRRHGARHGDDPAAARRRPAGGELIYMVNADEESGGRWGAGWVADNHPGEGRVRLLHQRGRRRADPHAEGLIFPICTGEKGRLEAKITKMGRSGHASRPWATPNPVPTLAQVIDKIAAYEPEIDASHPFFREVL